MQGFLKLLLAFLFKKTHTYFEAKGLRARHVAVKELLTDENKVYRLAFSESNVDRKWDGVILSDESIFSSTNDGPVLVYRPRGELYNSQYMSTCTRSGRVSVHCWGWISHQGPGMLHRIERHLRSFQYQHILQNAMLPFGECYIPMV